MRKKILIIGISFVLIACAGTAYALNAVLDTFFTSYMKVVCPSDTPEKQNASEKTDGKEAAGLLSDNKSISAVDEKKAPLHSAIDKMDSDAAANEKLAGAEEGQYSLTSEPGAGESIESKETAEQRNQVENVRESEDKGQPVKAAPDKIAEIQKKVSVSDKIKAFRIIFAKLTVSDIAKLKEMADNGVTDEEIDAAKRILKARISEEEKEEMKKLYSKYKGLIEK